MKPRVVAMIFVVFALLLVPVCGKTGYIVAIFENKDDDATVRVVKAPKQVGTGQEFDLEFEVKNVGKTMHTRAGNYKLAIGDHKRIKYNPLSIRMVRQSAPDEPNSDHNRMLLTDGDQVKPGQTHLYKCRLKHFAKSGETLKIDVRMVIEFGRAKGWPDGYFGQLVTIPIKVK